MNEPRQPLDQPSAAARIAELERANDELNSVNSVILRWDRQGRVVSINDFGLRLFGYRRDELVGKSVLETIVARTDGQGVDLAEMINQLLEDPARYAYNENENVRKDGSPLWLAWRNTPIYDERGQLCEVLTVGLDITERKRAEEALEHTRDQLAQALRERDTFLEALTDVFYVCDADLRLVRWNARLQEASGFGADQLRGLPLENLFEPDERELVSRQRATLTHCDGAACFLAHLTSEDGKRVPYEFNARRSEDAEGRPACFVGTARDMTERLAAEALTGETERIAAISRLAAGLLHELNTPFGVLNCNADVLAACLNGVRELVARADCPSGDRIRLETLVGAMDTSSVAMGEAVSRIQSLFKDLATFVRLDAPAFGPYEPSAALDSAARLAMTPADSEIELVREYEYQGRIHGRPADVNQALMKLLAEAVDGLRGHGRLRLRTRASNAWVEIQIEALGRDRVPREAPRFCEPGINWRADRITAGLGLFGAYHLIRRQRGELRIESDPELGMVFTVRLPRAEGSAQPAD